MNSLSPEINKRGWLWRPSHGSADPEGPDPEVDLSTFNIRFPAFLHLFRPPELLKGCTCGVAEHDSLLMLLLLSHFSRLLFT